MTEEKSNLPVKWDEEMAKAATEVASLETPPLAKISLRSGVMQYQGVVVPNNKLECIILISGFERRYDTKPFDAMNIQPPECFSLSLDDSDQTAPWPTIEEPQSEFCISCPQNAWQANPKKPGKNHKPCKERRRLILLPKTALEHKNIASAEMAMLTVPVTSLRHWGQYVNILRASHRRPPWGMVTEIQVTPSVANQFEVKFTPISPIPEDYLGEIHARLPGAAEAAMSPWDVVPLEKQKQQPQPEQKASTKY